MVDCDSVGEKKLKGIRVFKAVWKFVPHKSMHGMQVLSCLIVCDFRFLMLEEP